MPDIVSDRPVSGAAIATTWGQEIHDQIEGIQFGQINVTWSGAAGASNPTQVTFPKPYAAPPFVMAIIGNNQGTNAVAANYIGGVQNVSTTGCQIISRQYANATQPAGTLVPALWIAFGVLA